MTTSPVRLFRPVGLHELRLIADRGWRAFPPRLPEQPIFYPVLNQPYAEEIARKWNPTDPNSGFAGVVTVFEVEHSVAAQYDTQVVGGRQHAELWVPAEEQRAFEAAFTSAIQPLVAFVGDRIREALPDYEGPTGRLELADTRALVAAMEQGPLRGGPLTQG